MLKNERNVTNGSSIASWQGGGRTNSTKLGHCFSEIKDKLDIQIRQVDSLDGKTSNLLFISSIVIGIGAAAQAALIGKAVNA